jgi:large subunit ribosomal protein L22
MESVKSSARFVRTAPDKVRILVGLIKNKKIEDALAQLEFAGKYAAKPLILVLKQAKAQIKDRNLVEDNMIIKEMRVDEGPKLKRRRIRHQGRATAILKRLCHITILLNEKAVVAPKLGGKAFKTQEKENKGSV